MAVSVFGDVRAFLVTCSFQTLDYATPRTWTAVSFERKGGHTCPCVSHRYTRITRARNVRTHMIR